MAQTVEQKWIPTVYNMSSSQAFVVVWALEEVAGSHGIKYNLKNFPRRGKDTNTEFKAVSPLGKSPVVTLEPVGSQHPPLEYQVLPNTLIESSSILQFISDNFTTGERVPESPQDKLRDAFFHNFAKGTLLAKVDFVLLFEVIAMLAPWGIRHLLLLLFRPIISHFLGDLRDIYTVMENGLSEEKPWFSGSKIGLADFNMSFAMDMSAQRGYFDTEKYPKVAKWHAATLGRPRTRELWERQAHTIWLLSRRPLLRLCLDNIGTEGVISNGPESESFFSYGELA
ncbi:hypothetical protein LSUE1_G004640 [Lachnellula suecica]|uniref:GST C-terminal domain-containing protein n=1 Tax=Lachnellula suecica TaxID=602035 RepID=A0A8T9CIG5_9HELO|nr:hypothetical protein LSUE1_G004640 [Lachnellula suecica]